MEYQKIINLLDNTLNQLSKFKMEHIMLIAKLNSKPQC